MRPVLGPGQWEQRRKDGAERCRGQEGWDSETDSSDGEGGGRQAPRSCIDGGTIQDRES